RSLRWCRRCGTCGSPRAAAGGNGPRIVPERPGNRPCPGRAQSQNTCDRCKSLEQVFQHRVPGLGEVAAVIAPAPERQHAAVAQAVGELAQRAGGMSVRTGGEAQVRDRIAFEAVGAALQDDELGLEALEVFQYPRPDMLEYGIVRTRRQRHVE